jgi:hypothetical protein
MSTVQVLPARWNTTIQQGDVWGGARVRYLDDDGVVVPIASVLAQVRTDTVDRGGRLLATCATAALESGGWWSVTLDADATGGLPERQVFIDVDVTLDEEPTPPSVCVLKITAVVEGQVTEPEPEEDEEP